MLTPLHLACTYGMVGATRILLENGASLKNSGERKQTALHKACAVGMFNQVEMITYAAVQVYGKEEFKQVRNLKIRRQLIIVKMARCTAS